ncbi:putative F-box/FBD/LRR-repeat protein At1g78840 [Chenopodium quinoa]|uniref:putative F-box/FBD/LRR-repeat protein At1g78840 n=1 Tax=Chenopodium quinoa TaxID=63459 RepID=UPI000B77789E|nr:putative F-box/FBD/LRR-repeat protein At1g78840 [Chenopodium quinoa]
MIIYCEGIKELYIDSLTLDKLKICNESQFIAVKAPNIRCLDVAVDGSRYEVSNLSSLDEARICLGGYEYEPWKLELIRRVSKVQTLWLSQSTVELFGHVSENELPMFPNLTHLEIEIENIMFQMLKLAPKLTHLIVDVCHLLDDDALSFPSEIVPLCISSIQYIENQRFYCLEEDTKLVMYILKNAMLLKELKLHMHHHCVSLKRERDAFKKLLSFPRVSFCEVIICSSCEWETLPLHFPAISPQ